MEAVAASTEICVLGWSVVLLLVQIVLQASVLGDLTPALPVQPARRASCKTNSVAGRAAEPGPAQPARDLPGLHRAGGRPGRHRQDRRHGGDRRNHLDRLPRHLCGALCSGHSGRQDADLARLDHRPGDDADPADDVSDAASKLRGGSLPRCTNRAPSAALEASAPVDGTAMRRQPVQEAINGL